MFTILRNHGYEHVLNRYLPGVLNSKDLVSEDINILEARILKDINAIASHCTVNFANPLLSQIAAGIHLWGGLAGRNAFIKGGGFKVNCPMSAYGELVSLLMTYPKNVSLPDGNWLSIAALLKSFPNIGISFLTKHFSFWSRAYLAPIQLPILDKIIFQKFIEPSRLPAWKDYVPYVNEMAAKREILAKRSGLNAITISDIERQLFNLANSESIQNWSR